MRDPGAPNLILAGKAGDVGTGAADPPSLHNSGASPRLRHMPSEQLPAKSAAKDQNFNRFCLRHEHLPCPSSRSKRSRKGRMGTLNGDLEVCDPTPGNSKRYPATDPL